MTDSTSFNFFCAVNFPLMKQLKPLQFYDDAAKERILERAWIKLDGNHKQYYVNMVEIPPANGNTRFLALEVMREADVSNYGKDDAYEIYRTEMRLILLQDFSFVKHQYHEMHEVIQEGWNGLSEMQRLDFYERAILAKQVTLVKRPVVATKDNKQQPAIIESSPVTRESQHFEHEDMLLTNETDNNAFDRYVDAKRSQNSSSDINVLWKQWKGISDSEREIYYCNAYSVSLSNAKRLFVHEKETIRFNGLNQRVFATEQIEIQQAWNDIGDHIKNSYVIEAFNNLQRYRNQDRTKNPDAAQRIKMMLNDSFRAGTLAIAAPTCPRRRPNRQILTVVVDQDEKARFIGKYSYNRCDSATTYTDANAHLEILNPFALIHDDSEESAFIIYMEKLRPDMLKQPGMAKKRFWEVNLILKDQWNALNKDEQQPFYDTVNRYLELRNSLSEWKLEAKEVYDRGDAAFQKLDAETKKKYQDIALQNRKVFLKMYPDLQDYAQWIPNNDNNTDSGAVSSTDSSSTETKKDDTVKMDDKITIPTPRRPYQYADRLDRVAYEKYRKIVQSMTSEIIGFESYWPAFLNLSDEELNVYYAEAFKSESLKKARALFAKAYGLPVRNAKQNEAFIKELTKVYCTWESLSAPAKQYYVDIAKENLLECQKKKIFDVQYTDESHYEFKDEYGSLWGTLMPKCVYSSGSIDQEKAVMLYLNHNREDLLKEPGMANKREFQLAGIMQQRFKNLSDEERQPYFDIVKRVKEIRAHLNVCVVESYKIYSKNFGTSRKWKDASVEEKAVCEEVQKQNMATLLQKYPDVATYFHWVVNNHKNDKSRSDNTFTFVQKAVSVKNEHTEQAQEVETVEKPKVINNTMAETSKESEASTFEVVSSANGETSESDSKLETLQSVIVETVTMKSVKAETPDTVADAWEVIIDSTTSEKESKISDAEPTTAAMQESVPEKGDSLELHIESTVNGNTSEKSKSEGDGEVVIDDANVQKIEEAKLKPQSESENSRKIVDGEESASSKPSNTEAAEATVKSVKQETTANSVNTKKTPTAFMFYKKAMRRLNADHNFGKKDNDSQRQALIAGWKKLSYEEKAIYFKMENRARAEAQLLQLL